MQSQPEYTKSTDRSEEPPIFDSNNKMGKYEQSHNLIGITPMYPSIAKQHNLVSRHYHSLSQTNKKQMPPLEKKRKSLVDSNAASKNIDNSGE